MCLKQREPCVGAEKPEQFFDKIEGFVNTSKSLENLSKNLDSTDDNNSEESASLDTLSLNDQKSASEKRSDYQNKELILNKNSEYYSFGATLSESLPSSRSQSPDSNNNNKEEESRIILGESNENLTSDSNEKSQKNVQTNISATNIIASNPKINKSSSLYFSNKMDESKNRLPAAPASKTTTTKVKQETPLLTNLLLYSSAMTKVSNLKSNDNQRTNKL